ncbi:MAG: hypothetical protein U1E16_04665 [Hyphomicrobiales bacterium]
MKPPLEILLAAPRGLRRGGAGDRHRGTGAGPLWRAGLCAPEIVHNRFVVDDLKAKGAASSSSSTRSPTATGRYFSAHGVRKSVPAAASARHMFQLDATCPLVTQGPWRRAAPSQGAGIILIGRRGHPEVIGTMGQLPEGAVVLIETPEDVAKLR